MQFRFPVVSIEILIANWGNYSPMVDLAESEKGGYHDVLGRDVRDHASQEDA
jgi:hypothetical protein